MEMEWTTEANDYFKKVPPFVRPMAKIGVENYAKNHGIATITPEIISKAKGEMGHNDEGAASEKNMNVGTFNRKSSHMNHDKENFRAREDADPLKYAFSHKAAVHAGMTGTHLPEESVLSTWNALAAQKNHSKRRTIYLHIPFCKTRCRFCGFYMYGSKEEETKHYTKAICQEIRDNARSEIMQSHPIHAVFFGGGTPSALHPSDLEEILLTLQTNLPLSNDCEITVEGRVEDFTTDKIKACVAGGANRFSIGVQSFNTEVRRSMGRVADRKQVLSFLDTLTSQDQAAVIIDLIFGFPGQTMDIWQNDVVTFLNDTGVDGVDLYQLNIFRGGPLFKAIDEGKIEAAADIPLQGEMFERGVELCKEARMRRLSLAHWTRNARERNRYNSFTRFGSLCIPFGCGAGGRLPGHYFFQEGNLKNYYEMVKQGQKPVSTAMVLPDNTEFIRDLVGNMENLAVDLPTLGKKFDLDLQNIFSPLLSQWQKAGLIHLSKTGWMEFTIAGEFWNVTMAQKMIDFFNNIKNQKAA